MTGCMFLILASSLRKIMLTSMQETPIAYKQLMLMGKEIKCRRADKVVVAFTG